MIDLIRHNGRATSYSRIGLLTIESVLDDRTILDDSGAKHLDFLRLAIEVELSTIARQYNNQVEPGKHAELLVIRASRVAWI